MELTHLPNTCSCMYLNELGDVFTTDDAKSFLRRGLPRAILAIVHKPNAGDDEAYRVLLKFGFKKVASYGTAHVLFRRQTSKEMSHGLVPKKRRG